MMNWQSVLVGSQLPLGEAIGILDRGGLRIALVVDAERRLLGTLTDGDVRRALLRQVPLGADVTQAMNAKPLTATQAWSRERMLALMEEHQLLHVPVLDDHGRVVDLETLHGLLHKRHKGNPVFLMAGGFGTRLQPLTDNCPKPMLRVGDKPILELIVENFVSAGFHQFFISTHYMAETIRDHFGDGSRWGAQIRYVHEEQPLGTAGALGLLPRDEIDQPLFMMNGDLLTNLNFDNLLKFHNEHASLATMCVREYEHRVPYGVVESDGRRVRSMVEKPVHRYFVNAGIYVVSPELARAVEPGTRIDMPTLLEQQMAAGREVQVFPIHEYWLDIGRMEDFQRAQFEVGGIFHA
ncbi:CBS domain-containing protein [Rhizobacter sp. AJA081-3]|uniref:nucleotidyltransferase family protein n=1 Tax=Rhizobacter sp. AJA081-3 TaxID=2753607 RepID=UPI001AE0ABFF|nr:nucleotidyltransferase family protein [Rhizobacter sp. AJA081-3]QTN24266.1 CBS domain-containing protein [Rhizobacter sp. AJA081-3]